MSKVNMDFVEKSIVLIEGERGSVYALHGDNEHVSMGNGDELGGY